MTNKEAKEVLEEIKTLDDSLYQYNKAYMDALEMAIEMLGNQCEDCISRKYLIEAVEEGWIKFDTENDSNRYIHLVRDIAPSVTPKPKEGHWIHFAQSDECSVCGYDTGKYGNPTDYCPECGALLK